MSLTPEIPAEFFEETDPKFISNWLYYLGLPYWLYKKLMFEWANRVGVKLKSTDLRDEDTFPWDPGKRGGTFTPPNPRSPRDGA